MTANTGRTVNKYAEFIINDSGSTIRSLAINSLNGVGLTYDEVTDVEAWGDAVHSALPGQPAAPITVGGPFDSTATTGSHVVLTGVCGAMTPLTLDCKFGVRHAWDAEPQFGITATADNGYLCYSYILDPSTMTWTATFVPYPGSAAPAWGVAAET